MPSWDGNSDTPAGDFPDVDAANRTNAAAGGRTFTALTR